MTQNQDNDSPGTPDSSEASYEDSIHAMAWNLYGRPATKEEIEKSRKSADTLRQMRETDDLD